MFILRKNRGDQISFCTRLSDPTTVTLKVIAIYGSESRILLNYSLPKQDVWLCYLLCIDGKKTCRRSKQYNNVLSPFLSLDILMHFRAFQTDIDRQEQTRAFLLPE